MKRCKFAVTDSEYRIIVNALNEMRNKLIQEGRYTDAVDELILKLFDAPIRKVKIL